MVLHVFARMDPVFFILPEGALLGWSESIEDEILVEEIDGEHFESDSESRSIDYGDSSVSSADTYLFEDDVSVSDVDVNPGLISSDYIMFVPLQAMPVENPEQVLREQLHRDFLACLSSTGELNVVNSEEDYITSQKFEHGQTAIVISTHHDSTEFTYWNNPLFISTVEKLLASGNTRNPLDNTPMKGFRLVKIKCS